MEIFRRSDTFGQGVYVYLFVCYELIEETGLFPEPYVRVFMLFDYV